MSSAGHVLDMIKRMRQNRSLRASNRQKFKGDNRENIYSDAYGKDSTTFTEFPKSQVREAIIQIRNRAKSKRRREWILLTIIGIIGTIIVVTALYPSKERARNTLVKSSRKKQKTLEPILWSGKLSEPLKIPFSNLFYIPIVGNLDYVDLKKAYEMTSHNMVVDFTSNILFLNQDCVILRKLLPENSSITYMTVGPENEKIQRKKIIYFLTKNEPNTYGKTHNLEEHFLYISDIDGKNLTKITERKFRSFQWVDQGKAIQVNFYYNKKMNENIHGIFTIETNEFELVNRTSEQ